jgi:hypothetical protein
VLHGTISTATSILDKSSPLNGRRHKRATKINCAPKIFCVMKEVQAGGRSETLLSRLESDPPRNRGGDKYESSIGTPQGAGLARPFTTHSFCSIAQVCLKIGAKFYELGTS